MIDENNYRLDLWNTEVENWDYAKKAIITILKEEKVSLSKTRHLFNSILQDIERNNPITL